MFGTTELEECSWRAIENERESVLLALYKNNLSASAMPKQAAHPCAFTCSCHSQCSSKGANMTTASHFLLHWNVDSSLSVTTANAIQLGEKVVGGAVTALYQRKQYDATIVALGKLFGFSNQGTCRCSNLILLSLL